MTSSIRPPGGGPTPPGDTQLDGPDAAAESGLAPTAGGEPASTSVDAAVPGLKVAGATGSTETAGAAEAGGATGVGAAAADVAVAGVDSAVKQAAVAQAAAVQEALSGPLAQSLTPAAREGLVAFLEDAVAHDPTLQALLAKGTSNP